MKLVIISLVFLVAAIVTGNSWLYMVPVAYVFHWLIDFVKEYPRLQKELYELAMKDDEKD